MKIYRSFLNDSKLKKIKYKGDKVVLDFDYCLMEIHRKIFDEYEFIIGNTYSKDFLSLIRKEDDFLMINNYVFSLDENFYNEFEIRKKINSKFKDFPFSTKKEAFESLKKSKIIDDVQFAKDTLNYFNNKNYGKNKIIKYLYDKHINKHIIEDLVFDEEKEMEKANNFYQEIVHKYNNLPEEKKLSKISNNLYRQGFERDVIETIIINN